MKNNRSKYIIAALVFSMLTMTACDTKKGSGKNFKGYVEDRESFPVEEETSIEDYGYEEDTELDELSESTESSADIDLSSYSEIDTSSVDDYVSTTEAETSELEAEPTAETTISSGQDMTDIVLRDLQNSENDYFTVSDYEVFQHKDKQGYDIKFHIESKGDAEYSFSVPEAKINGQIVDFSSAVEGSSMTIRYVLQDDVYYGDMCSSFEATIVASSKDTGEEVYRTDGLKFKATLRT